ncbi:hypothetical protein DQ353_00435 [Arthrobacter sp. AQ5-05]|uniref:recombinase family protein n=1 Tax=Arthrobacter sp. AQ5-05 TaxID=2184581 RepID=UPI000DCB3312|nr:recombinase family protein [Arthrobacter sp. AQ5-05]RAX50903.1 hypothetical protein DQ353_00435 [Arthrobacter sp. AQ5-05]
MKHAKNAVIYCRISSDPGGEGLGVTRQQEDCEALATKLGWGVATVIIDNDRSAYSGRKRPGYTQLLQGLRDGTFDGVLAWHSDRLHRRPMELEEYIHVCQAQGVRTHTVKGGEVDLATPEGMLRAGMLGQIARYESAHKSDRLVRQEQQAAEQGKWRGGPRPFGYQAGAQELEPVEADAVRRAYDMVLEGHTLASIVRDWEARSLKTTRGNTFTTLQLRAILLREKNYGASIYRGEVVKTDAFPAIISEDKFSTVKAILTAPGRRLNSSTKGRWLLAGLALCGRCNDGSKMITAAVGTPAKKINTYRCATGKHMGRRVEYVDKFVTDLLLHRMSLPDAAQVVHKGSGKDVEALRSKVDSLRAKLDEYALLLADDVMTPLQFREANSVTKDRLQAAERELYHPGASPVLERLLGAPDLRKEWDSLEWAQKRSMVRLYMSVTILPVPKGLPPAFDPRFVDVHWLT